MMKDSLNGGVNLQSPEMLEGLISEMPSAKPVPEAGAQWIAIDQIKPGKYQPRKYFSESNIESLAQSFKAEGFRGVLNVRRVDKDTYEIVAGQRRWRAAQKAGLTEVRCLVDQYSDEDILEFAIVENLQREDLSKLEETEGILQLTETKLGIRRDAAISLIRTEGHSDRQSQSDVAASETLQTIAASLSRFNIELQTFRAKNLRTLTLPDELKEAHLKQGLYYSTALELNKVKDQEARTTMLKKILSRDLLFREVKQQVKYVALAPRYSDTPIEQKVILDRLEKP